MLIQIETRSEYELFVRKEVDTRDMPDYMVEPIIKLILIAFDEGIRFASNDLKVDINE